MLAGTCTVPSSSSTFWEAVVRVQFRRRTAFALAAVTVAVPLAVAGASSASAAEPARVSAPASSAQAAPAVAGAQAGAFDEVFREKFVQAGDWRTLERFINASGTGFFLHPAGAQIKVRYGVGFLGFDSQKQTLDGRNEKSLSVGGVGTYAQARMQIRVSEDTWVRYVVRVP
jgi:hypothetical protein